MVEGLGIERARVVFEFGAGTGALTAAILGRMRPGARFVAVEINPAMVRCLRRRFPGLEIMEDSAEHIEGYRRCRGIGSIDCIVCGLPWALFSEERQEALLDAVVNSLGPEGTFATFAYLHSLWFPASKRLARKLRGRFGWVTTTRPVWRNLPPALVYRCRRPVSCPQPVSA
jgi:phospholipid N-methyltransferase